MPGCLHCGKQWPDGFMRCPDDGTTLAPSYHAGHASQPTTAGGAAPALADAGDEDLAAGSFAGEYRIERKIGEGGMGSVYGARHPVIGKRAAIKVIRRELSTNREAVDRFVLEAQSVNQIGHPNIVDVFGFGQLPDGRSFFVMEWLEGESLRDRMKRTLQFPESLETLEQIAKALEAAHEAGVVHRDLKPDNVYLQARKGEKPTVKLLDFGLAKLTGRNEGAQQFDRTRTGMVMGTPLYISPEQAKGAKIDSATDVYSLGAMAYEMLCGVVPFKADSAVEIMAMHISHPVTQPIEVAPWIPPEINALVLRMMEKDARARPTVTEVRDGIAACRARASAATIGLDVRPMQIIDGRVTPLPPGMIPGTPPPPMAPQITPPMSLVSAPPSSGKKTVVVIAGLVVVAGLVGTALYVALGKRKEAQPENVASATQTMNVTSTPPVPPQPAPPAGSAEVAAQPPPEAAPVPPPPTDTKPDAPKPDAPKPVTTHHVDAPKRGKVIVSFAGPDRATVIVDGKSQGREAGGKVTLELTAGDHTIRIQAKGYKPADTKVHVDANGSRDVSLTLEKRKSVNAVHDPFAE